MEKQLSNFMLGAGVLIVLLVAALALPGTECTASEQVTYEGYC